MARIVWGWMFPNVLIQILPTTFFRVIFKNKIKITKKMSLRRNREKNSETETEAETNEYNMKKGKYEKTYINGICFNHTSIFILKHQASFLIFFFFPLIYFSWQLT